MSVVTGADDPGAPVAVGASPRLSLVVPVYNSGPSLIELADRAAAALRGIDHEIIFVDDGSTAAETWPTLRALAAARPGVMAVQLTRNFGRAAAVLCGIEHARGAVIVTLDDDLQHRPEDIPALYALREHDVVVAQFPVRHHGWLNRLTSRIKAVFDHKILGVPRHIRMTSFLLLRAETARNMLRIRTPYPFIPALVFFATKDVASVNVEHTARKFGRGELTFRHRVRMFSHLIINNSSYLLKVIAGIGLTAAVGSILLGLYLLIRWPFASRIVAGWTSLMLMGLTMGGLILFTLGVIGEYLIRIIYSIERRPPFLVRRTIARRANTP